MGKYRVVIWSAALNGLQTVATAFTDESAWSKAKAQSKRRRGRAIWVYRGAVCIGSV